MRGTGPVRLLRVAAGCAVLFCVLAAAVAWHAPGVSVADHAAHAWTVRHRSGPAVAVARVLTATGTGPWPYAAAVAAGLAGGRTPAGRLRTVAASVLCLALGQAARYGVMRWIARPRPPVVDWAAHASGHSFPSGHATTSALAAGLLCWAVSRRTRRAVARGVCAVLACWATAVGLTRVELGVHWAGDVVAGWLFATAWLTAAAAVSAARWDVLTGAATAPPGCRTLRAVGQRALRRIHSGPAPHSDSVRPGTAPQADARYAEAPAVTHREG